MTEDRQEKLPLDTKLLSEAVIELNISKRSVGLYPHEHPFVRRTIDRAFEHLQRLFELRSGITLGIAKDALVVDEFMLDRKNPVFSEFATSLHSRGIAAVTFSLGLTREELIGFLDILTSREVTTGEQAVELAAQSNVTHIGLTPIDYSSFAFVEGAQKTGADGENVWEDYVYGLLEGRLSPEGGVLCSIPPEEMAALVNRTMEEGKSADDAYDRVIISYLRKKGEPQLSRDSFGRFISFVNYLKPELRSRFLSRSFGQSMIAAEEVEAVLSGMEAEDFEKMVASFLDHAAAVPGNLQNLLDKFSETKGKSRKGVDLLNTGLHTLDDMELSEDVMALFSQDMSETFMKGEYREQLDRMFRASQQEAGAIPSLAGECRDEVIDRTALDVMLEVLEDETGTGEDYPILFGKLGESVNLYLETGRFNEILKIHESFSGFTRSRAAGPEVESLANVYFGPDFVTSLVQALRIWGRKDRDGAAQLAHAFRSSLIRPLLESLAEEGDVGVRKFMLSILSSFGEEVIPEALKMLNDRRWYVIRNVLYLIRECNDSRSIDSIKRFAKHPNINVRFEALKSLLHFRTPDAIPYLKAYLQSDDPELRGRAVRLAAAHRVREAVPFLLKLLERKKALGAEADGTVDVIRALAEIGDARAVPSLEAICRTKALFFKGELETVKTEIFRNLGNYPREAVRKIAEMGISSKNEEVRLICQRMLQDSRERAPGRQAP